MCLRGFITDPLNCSFFFLSERTLVNKTQESSLWCLNVCFSLTVACNLRANWLSYCCVHWLSVISTRGTRESPAVCSKKAAHGARKKHGWAIIKQGRCDRGGKSLGFGSSSNWLGSRMKVADVGERVEVQEHATYCRRVPQMKVEDEHCEFLLSFPAAHFPGSCPSRGRRWILRLCSASLQAGQENVNLCWRNPRVPVASWKTCDELLSSIFSFLLPLSHSLPLS